MEQCIPSEVRLKRNARGMLLQRTRRSRAFLLCVHNCAHSDHLFQIWINLTARGAASLEPFDLLRTTVHTQTTWFRFRSTLRPGEEPQSSLNIRFLASMK